jgi:hypothetical protein
MSDTPLLYYRSKEQIDAYRALPAEQKVRKLEMEMELMHYMRQGRARLVAEPVESYIQETKL